jgi:hypothetical protein
MKNINWRLTQITQGKTCSMIYRNVPHIPTLTPPWYDIVASLSLYSTLPEFKKHPRVDLCTITPPNQWERA